MLDPEKSGSKAVRWLFPTGDRTLGDWQGGIIGSVAVNDTYDPWGRRPRLAAFIAIDGNLYVVAQDALKSSDGGWFTVKIKEIDSFSGGRLESTPVMWKGRVIIGSRDGSLYCLGDR